MRILRSESLGAWTGSGRLQAYSRYAATPPTWVIEWSAGGTDYLGLGPSAEPDFARGWPILQALLAGAEGAMTRLAVWCAWPDAGLTPAKQTLWKWLTCAVRERRALQRGRGNSAERFAAAPRASRHRTDCHSLPGRHTFQR